jgi:putative toxin-antitoxin system antitoxin component (TIGR02293 family)
MRRGSLNTKPFNTQRSVRNAGSKQQIRKVYLLTADGQEYTWSNAMERLGIVRIGIPYNSIEVISNRINCSIKNVLDIVGIPQTTYNSKKSNHALLDVKNSELILLINELIDYGTEVFNNEFEKFQHWLKKKNNSLGGNTPESLLDTSSGIDEVRNCLNRIEYGNFA